LHVVARDGNPNGAHAKSGDRHVPVRSEVLACYDHYLAERRACGPAEACDFVLVNLGHEPFGVAMTTGTVRQWLAALSKTAGLDRAVRPHMFRHATASELVGRGVGLDVVRELLGHASVRSTEVYVHPDPDALRSAVDRLGPLGSSGESARGGSVACWGPERPRSPAWGVDGRSGRVGGGGVGLADRGAHG
jgi:integrase